jgi:integrase
MNVVNISGRFVVEDRIQGKNISEKLKARTPEEAAPEAEAAVEKWRERLRNIYLRGGRWYVRAVVSGRRISQGMNLPEQDWELAGRRARAILDHARKDKWAVLEATRSRSNCATFAECIAIFRQEAPKHDLRTRTVNDYVSSLQMVIGAPDATFATMPVTAASKEAVRAYVNRRLVEAGEAVTDSAKRSIVSTARQARSIFGEDWVMEAYKDAGLELPDMTEFRKCSTLKAPPVRYRLPPLEIREKTLAAAECLRSERRDLWTIYLLAYWLAMRAGEMIAVRWSWLEQDHEGRWWMQIIRREDENFRPKGSEGKVPVPKQVMAWLEELRASRPGELYIVPGKDKTDRAVLVGRTFAKWMREIGWKTRKTAHELRKLRGCEWYTKRGLEVACAWLRHNDPSTTKRFYVDFTAQPPTLEVGE